MRATRITVYAAVKFVGIVKAGVTVRGDQCFLARSGVLTAMSPKSRLHVGREVPIVANDLASSPELLDPEAERIWNFLTSGTTYPTTQHYISASLEF
jgi:hypothetical protein